MLVVAYFTESPKIFPRIFETERELETLQYQVLYFLDQEVYAYIILYA